MRVVAIFIYLFYVLLPTTFAQGSRIDEKKAEAFARRFTRRLEQSKNVEPLFSDFFAHGFKKYVRDGKFLNDVLSGIPKIDRKIDDRAALQYFTGFFNLVFLNATWSLSHYSSDSIPGD